MSVKQAQQQAKIFMENSRKLVSWLQIKNAKDGNIRIDGICYNIHGQKKIKLS